MAQETRLDIFRYLVEVGPEGAPAGTIGERFDLPLPTLSFHLKTLQQAGLLERQRQSRSLIYSSNFNAMNALLAYLTENCCAGDRQACAIIKIFVNLPFRSLDKLSLQKKLNEIGKH